MVIIGIDINVASAYVKGPCDRILSASSKWWATRTEAQRKARDERIALLRTSKDEQTFALIQALHVRVRSIMMIVVGFVLLVTALTFRDVAMARFVLKIVGDIQGIPTPAAHQEQGPTRAQLLRKGAIGLHETKNIFPGLDGSQVKEIPARQPELGQDRSYFLWRQRS